jgi:hypothetical protein
MNMSAKVKLLFLTTCLVALGSYTHWVQTARLAEKKSLVASQESSLGNARKLRDALNAVRGAQVQAGNGELSMLKFVRAALRAKDGYSVTVSELNVRGVSVANTEVELKTLQQAVGPLGLTTQGVWLKGNYESLDRLHAWIKLLVPSHSALVQNLSIVNNTYEIDFIITGAKQ